MEEIRFDVALTPNDIKKDAFQLCVLVDVLRATTAMVIMLDKGCDEIILTNESRPDVRNNRFTDRQTLYCAEDEEGNVDEQAQFGPSLHLLGETYVKKKSILLKTTNGTRAGITLCNQGIENVLIGSLRNAEAVMKKAVDIADNLGVNISIVCAGRQSGKIPALDDVYTAGALLEYGEKAARKKHQNIVFSDAAKISKNVVGSFQSIVEAFEESASGETMRSINCQIDIRIAAQKNLSTLTPFLTFTKEGNISIKK